MAELIDSVATRQRMMAMLTALHYGDTEAAQAVVVECSPLEAFGLVLCLAGFATALLEGMAVSSGAGMENLLAFAGLHAARLPSS